MVVEKGERCCILVGVQIDGDGRELLGWVIANLAEEGNRVVAVNVTRNQDLGRNPTPSLIKLLDECLSKHQDLCTMKKIVLVGRTLRGNSIKKVLVKEAENCAAKAVVVGANKDYSFRGSASLANYCQKKLPSTIDLIAVHKEQIIFKRAAAKPKVLPELDKPNLRTFLHPSVGMDTKIITPSSRSKSEPKNYCLLDYEKMREKSRSSIPVLADDLPESKPGWPLLRRSANANIESLKESEARKMSVIHWVMSLPDRSFAADNFKVELFKELKIILKNSSSSCKLFQYEELQISTNYFSSDNLIGKGGNSKVYMGRLPDGRAAAIKASKLSEESSKDFLLEVQILTKLRHDRIVPLIGVCVDDNNLYSVYSYFSKGSLQENIHGNGLKGDALNWEMRMKVAVGVAEALCYLHENGSRAVIHRDVKSSNILLSDDFNPQLSDFGLAVWASTGAPCPTHIDVVGTFGYIAPEYFMYGKVSNKIDVYAFGVVLLELLTGRKPINDESPKGQESLVLWAKPVIERGDIKKLLDPNLSGKYEEEEMKRMALAASLCIRKTARLRPPIRQVLDLLQGKVETNTWARAHAGSNGAEQDCPDEEADPAPSIGEHLGLALLDVDDDASVISFEHNNISSLDEYIQNRWSRSSSFD